MAAERAAWSPYFIQSSTAQGNEAFATGRAEGRPPRHLFFWENKIKDGNRPLFFFARELKKKQNKRWVEGKSFIPSFFPLRFLFGSAHFCHSFSIMARWITSASNASCSECQ